MTLLASAKPLALALALVASAQSRVDPDLPEYTPVKGVSGKIKSVGSDTMNNLMAHWAEGFRAMYPNVQVEVEGKGSATAPPALVSGAANFGPMSRPMKDKEIDEFEERYGYRPTLIEAGIDMLAVFVHKDNPIESLTLQQVDAIFSKSRKGGHGEDVRTWGDLGLDGAWAKKPISLYGRNSASGTYGYFKQFALFGGDFKDDVKEQSGSSSVVQGVGSDKFGIGYSGIGYETADVKTVPIAKSEGKKAQPPSTGRYPLSRVLYLYVNKEPNRPLDPLRREFVRYVFSRQGQEDVAEAGFYPVPASRAAATLEKLGLEPESAPN